MFRLQPLDVFLRNEDDLDDFLLVLRLDNLGGRGSDVDVDRPVVLLWDRGLDAVAA